MSISPCDVVVFQLCPPPPSADSIANSTLINSNFIHWQKTKTFNFSGYVE